MTFSRWLFISVCFYSSFSVLDLRADSPVYSVLVLDSTSGSAKVVEIGEGNNATSGQYTVALTPEWRGRGIAAIDGGMAIFNGTFKPVLSLLTPKQLDIAGPVGWGIVNNAGAGAIGRVKLGPDEFVFAPSANLAGSTGRDGLVRFNTHDKSSIRFGNTNDDTHSYKSVKVGLDSRVYAVHGGSGYRSVDIYDPARLVLLGTVLLKASAPNKYETDYVVTADASGNIYGVNYAGDVTKFDPRGNVVAHKNLFVDGKSEEINYLNDVEVSPTGSLVFSSMNGAVYRWNTNLSDEPVQIYNSGSSEPFQAIFVSSKMMPGSVVPIGKAGYYYTDGYSAPKDGITAISGAGAGNSYGQMFAGLSKFNVPRITGSVFARTNSCSANEVMVGWQKVKPELVLNAIFCQPLQKGVELGPNETLTVNWTYGVSIACPADKLMTGNEYNYSNHAYRIYCSSPMIR